MKHGSMFSGVGGFELLMESLGVETTWHCENDPQASAVLERWWPGVPNHGDVTAVDWSEVEKVEVLSAGFPCQGISLAGKGLGLEDERSGLVTEVFRAVRVLRPGIIFVENSSALVHRGLPVVIGGLAEMGYDATWGLFRAAEIGAPHRRNRIYIIATDTDTDSVGWDGWSRPSGSRWWAEPPNSGNPFANPNSLEPERRGEPGELGGAQAAQQGQGLQRQRPGDAARDRSPHNYGRWEPAVRRWESLTRTAPPATVGGRLNPDFSEWLMGFPEGWTAGHAKTHRIRMCGNAIVPQVARAAFIRLMEVHTRTRTKEPIPC